MHIFDHLIYEKWDHLKKNHPRVFQMLKILG